MKKKRNNPILVGMVIILIMLIAVGKSLASSSVNNEKDEDSVAQVAMETYELQKAREVKTVEAPKSLEHFQELEYIETSDKSVVNAEIQKCKDYEFRLVSLIKNPQMTSEKFLIETEISKVRKYVSNYEMKLKEILEEEARIEAERQRAEAEKKRIEAEKAEKAKLVVESKPRYETSAVDTSGEYPVATKVWRYMKDVLGWNDYVAAGVMGNMMAEVGGQTLNLDYRLYGHNGAYYGICQWSGQYYPEVQGAGLDYQLQVLANSVKKEIDMYGWLYRSGMDYYAFTQISNAQEAALAFAKAYERCGSGSYGVRQENALKALNYFTN